MISWVSELYRFVLKRWLPSLSGGERLGRKSTLILAFLALVLGVVSFSLLSEGLSFTRHRYLQFSIFVLNLVVFILLVLALTGEIKKLLSARKRGLAAARLHVRLVVLFGIISAVPTLLVGGFAAIFFHYGIQIWFNDRINTALDEALQVSRGYLQEHNANIRTDAFSLASYLETAQNDFSQSGRDLFHDPETLAQILDTQATLRGLDEAAVYDPYTNEVIAAGGLTSRTAPTRSGDLPSPTITALTRSNDVAILDNQNTRTIKAAIRLGGTPSYILLITRPIDAEILAHMHQTENVVAEYHRLSKNRLKIQSIFVLIFALVALLLLVAAVLVGFILANQIVRPIGLLILASDKVSRGNLDVRVPEASRDDEVAALSRVFNHMLNQLSAQRAELMAAYAQINERRRFTEAVLSGVSAGVIGLDLQQRVELPNRAACALLGRDIFPESGKYLGQVVPEFAPLLEQARHSPHSVQTQEIRIESSSAHRVLLVRISPEMNEAETNGYVVTFDDITDLQSAQRKAAWADVARRIAHEIKNPLTPIQLSAERLRRRFMKEIHSDPEIFSQCVDTIIRHVGDIGRMADEFSAFARMPQPVLKQEDLSRIVRGVVLLQRDAHPEIDYRLEIPDNGPVILCDRRQISQVLTNLLQNAADAIAMARQNCESTEVLSDPAMNVIGTIWLSITQDETAVRVYVADDGIGLPENDRLRLTEPYVTHKVKGTGLGLAIVKKIMEDHKGSLHLDDRPEGKGTVVTLTLPVRDGHAGNSDS